MKTQTGLVLGAWLGFAALTERWRPWGDGIKLQYATDVRSYELIARAAPGFPSQRIDVAHSDRFIPHWLVGEIGNLFHVGLHLVYQVATGAILVGVALVVAATLQALRASLPTIGICLGALVASAYPFRYLADSPGMITDGLFLLGLAVTVHGFVARRARWIVVGLAVATLGRQTGLPLAVAAAALLVARGRWRVAAAAVVVSVLVYVVPHELSTSWASSGRGFVGMTFIGGSWTLHTLATHIGRCLIALALPLALVALGWLRGGVRPALAPLALGIVTLGEALVLSPDWTHAEPRLAGLAVPALVVAAAPSLDAARLGRLALLPVAGIALASFHHLYSVVAPDGQRGWAAFVVLGAGLAVSPAIRRARE